MRLVAGALALTLFASFARADDTRTAEPIHSAASTAPTASAADVTHGKVPLRVVRVMSQSHQALLFDRDRATHILAEVGSKLDGYTVEAIDDDEVTLSSEGKQIVLAAPARGGSRRHDRDLAATHVRSAVGARQTDTTASDPTPIDPYGEAAIRVVEAPGAPGAADGRPAGHTERVIEAGDGGIRVAEAPGGTASQPTGTASQPISTASQPISTPSQPASTAAAPAIDARPVGSKVPGIRVVEAPTSAMGPQASDPRPADPRPEAKAPEVRAADAARPADKRTSDARAMADIMSADSSANSSANSRPQGARLPASGAPSPATRAPAADPRSTSTPQPASDVRTASAAPSEAVLLARSDVDGALADFAKLATAVRGSFSASGLAVGAVSEGSIFQRAGLRNGDVITAVDGAPLRSLDDAANLYARASTTKSITAQVLRGGKPMTLHVAIQ